MAIPASFPYARSGNVELTDEFGSALVNAGVVNATVIEYRVPYGVRKAWVTLFGHGISNPGAWATSVFRILINGVPQRPYNNIQDELGKFSEPEEIGPIPLKSGDVVAVRVDNNSATNNIYAARLRGFNDFGVS